MHNNLSNNISIGSFKSDYKIIEGNRYKGISQGIGLLSSGRTLSYAIPIFEKNESDIYKEISKYTSIFSNVYRYEFFIEHLIDNTWYSASVVMSEINGYSINLKNHINGFGFKCLMIDSYFFGDTISEEIKLKDGEVNIVEYTSKSLVPTNITFEWIVESNTLTTLQAFIEHYENYGMSFNVNIGKGLFTITYDGINLKAEKNGESKSYPPTVLTDVIGKKTGIFEYNFSTTTKEALDYAYQSLKLQTPLETLKLKNINYKSVSLHSNQCLQVVLKPSENYYEDFEINFSASKSISSNLENGTIQTIGTIIGYSRKAIYSKVHRKTLDFNTESEYVNIFNRSFKINRIILYYISENSTDKFLITDGKKENIIFGSAGVLRIDLHGFSKRELKLILLNDKSEIVFSKMRCYFNQGSKKVVMNVREITYSCKKGVINVNATLSKLNTTLTGYMFERDRKIRNLEKLLTNN